MAGRPRSAALNESLLAATRALLARDGYPAVTVDEVARRAGVPKSALYRRWRSKAELVFAAVVHGADIAVADTGGLGGDLRDLAARVCAALTGDAARHALPGLLADLDTDPELRRRFDDQVIAGQRRLVRTVLDRAVARGELSPDADPDAVHAQLLGTAFARAVLLPGPVPSDLPDQLATGVLAVLMHRGERP